MARRQALGTRGKSILEADFTAVKSDLNLLNRKLTALEAVAPIAPAKNTLRRYAKPVRSRPTSNTLLSRVHSGAWFTEGLPSGRTPAKPTLEDIDGILSDILDESAKELKGKARKWAIETVQGMKAVAPLRTENLMESIKILKGDKATEAEYSYSVKRQSIEYVVGVDEKAILPPPHRKRVKHGANIGKMVTMSPFNYTGYADAIILKNGNPKHQGYDFLNRWAQIAQQNIERIFK